MNKINLSIEARMTSSRLPGKVLMDIGGKPALDRMLERIKESRYIQQITLATTTNKTDDILEEWSQLKNINCFRGSEDDVLQRIVDAHKALNSDIVVETTGDCPLLDPEIIDYAIDIYLANDVDILSVGRVSSYPLGICEVMIFKLSDLDYVAKNFLNDPPIREHPCLYFYENKEKYKIIDLVAPIKHQNPDLRITLDYKEDLDVIREIWNSLQPKYGNLFGINEITELIKSSPDIFKKNSKCFDKPMR